MTNWLLNIVNLTWDICCNFFTLRKKAQFLNEDKI